jgi:hypothetical protein
VVNISVNSQQPMRRLVWKLSANQRQDALFGW